MKTLYTDMNIRFQIEGTEFLVLNIIFERFSRCIPRHSHGHNCYELHYIPNGNGTVCIDGENYSITDNTLYITGPHVEHEQKPETGNPMSEYCLYFKISETRGKSSSLMQQFCNTPLWFGQDSQDIHTNMRLIFQELENGHTGYMTQVETLLQQCIVKLIRNYEHGRTSQNRFGHSNLNDRRYIITEEYFLYEYQTLSIESLAEKLGLSVRQTNRFLKEYYGKNFQQKKAEAKMSAATILLTSGSKSVTEIAAELGYSSLEHFAAAFKRYYGMSTREYRRQCLEQEMSRLENLKFAVAINDKT